jgi:predicted flap endonuclease-1-like 5' DNA nuclease
MWFLLLQISLLLLLAALLGAALAWWWLKRRYEDVTETHERLISENTRMERLAQLASKDDLKTGIATLTSAVTDIKPADFSPVLDRIERLERMLAAIRMPDLGPIERRLGALDPISGKLADITREVSQISPQIVGQIVPQIPKTDLTNVETKINALEATIRSIRIPAPDLGPVHSGIATLQIAMDKVSAKPQGLDVIESFLGDIESKLVALGGLQRQVGDLGDKIDASRAADHEAVSGRLSALSTSLGSLRNTDLDPIAQRLTAVEQAITNFHIPATDLRPLHASVIDLERAVLDKPPVDLGPLHNRLAAVQASLAGMQSEIRNRQALDMLERRIASLQEAVQGIPEPDLAPVIGAVHSIDAKLDLGAMENRLTAIEYGLAALHHSLRSRPETVVTRTESAWQPRPVMTTVQKSRLPAPPRPPREIDPINAFRRADDQANLLIEPAFGTPDDLEQIHAIGPMLRELLNDIGVYYFWQVAEWTPEEVAFVDGRLMHFKGRIRRDDWIDHARTLVTSPSAARRPMPSQMSA